MADKTNFSDLVSQPEPDPVITPDQKACANCAHGRGRVNSQNGKSYIQCRAQPPSVLIEPAESMTGIQGLVVRNRWPAMALDEECDSFEPKSAADTGTKEA